MSEFDHEDKSTIEPLQVNAGAVRDITDSSISPFNSLDKGGQSGMELEPDVGDEVLPCVDVRDAQPPKVTYHHG